MRVRLAAVLLLGVLYGCNGPSGFQPDGKAVGRVDSLEQAADAAKVLTSLTRPLTILDARSGIARDIYTGAYPSWAGGMVGVDRAREQFQLKLTRPAWRVRLTGQVPPGEDCCVWEEIIIDQETGSVLFSVQADGIPDNR